MGSVVSTNSHKRCTCERTGEKHLKMLTSWTDCKTVGVGNWGGIVNDLLGEPGDVDIPTLLLWLGM